MLRHELQISQLRFYDEPTDDPFATYDAICTIVWESPDTVWVKGFHGDLTRRTLRELIAFFVENKIEKIKAHRSIARSLPGVTFRDGTFVELSVQEIIRKARRAPQPDPVDLNYIAPDVVLPPGLEPGPTRYECVVPPSNTSGA